ncbi:MAG: preprotein translocase subunit YajC [Myxococcota bacterium]|nr:preprotein translocase subunit YajC [Myxococcota bacterium]
MGTNWATILGAAQPSSAAGSSGQGVPEGTATEGVPDHPGGAAPMPGPCGGGDSTTTIIMMLLMVAAFYFLLIRPQQKKTKEHQNMLGNLKKGDEVVTQGGLIGKVTGFTDKLITLEISEKVRVRVLKSQIIDKFSQ